jgi:hypothetical protein
MSTIEQPAPACIIGARPRGIAAAPEDYLHAPGRERRAGIRRAQRSTACA